MTFSLQARLREEPAQPQGRPGLKYVKGICAVCGKSLEEHAVGEDGWKHYCKKQEPAASSNEGGAGAAEGKGKGKSKKGRGDKGSAGGTGGGRAVVAVHDELVERVCVWGIRRRECCWCSVADGS